MLLSVGGGLYLLVRLLLSFGAPSPLPELVIVVDAVDNENVAWLATERR